MRRRRRAPDVIPGGHCSDVSSPFEPIRDGIIERHFVDKLHERRRHPLHVLVDRGPVLILKVLQPPIISRHVTCAPGMNLMKAVAKWLQEREDILEECARVEIAPVSYTHLRAHET